MKIYVDVINGNDQSGDGSSSNPYKSISFVAEVVTDGDSIIVNSSTSEEVFKDRPIVIQGKTNITIDFLRNSSDEYSKVIWEAIDVGDHKAIVSFIECTDCKITGANFTSCHTEGNVISSAIIVDSCQDMLVGQCNIHESWVVTEPFEETSSLFLFKNSTDTVISKLSAKNLNNSFNNDMDILSLKEGGTYEVYSCDFRNISCNNYTLAGIHVYSDVKSVTIDGALMHIFNGDIDGNCIGVMIEGAQGECPEFIINSCQLSNLHYGIAVLNSSYSSNSSKISHSTFYRCRTAIMAYSGYVAIYSCSLDAGDMTYSYEYPPGYHVTSETVGILAKSSANIQVTNSLITGTNYACKAVSSAAINLDHVLWYACNSLSTTSDGGRVNQVEYVRAINPEYENLTQYPWGNFMVSGTSPCIDAGKHYGEEYLGNGPDIGAYERSKTIRMTDLPSMLHKSVRTATMIPLTNIDIEGMICQGLNTCDPSMKSGREGSVIKDIAVKPLAGMLEPFVTQLEAIRKNMSFADMENLTKEDADALAANMFVTRRRGHTASGVIRLYYNEPRNSSILAEMGFSTNSGLKFYTSIATSITAEEMSLNYEDGLYYMDVPAEAEDEGAYYNISAGEITTSLGTLPAGVVSLTNPTEFSGGSISESNRELYERTKMAITTRDLVTKRSISYVLTEKFPSISDITCKGFGDPEMLRDVVLDYHIGGKVDTYIKSENIVDGSMILEKANLETPINAVTWGDVPVLRITSIDVLDRETGDTTGNKVPENMYNLVVSTPNTRFSVYESMTLQLNPSYAGQMLQVNYQYVTDMQDIQAFVIDDDNRVLCTDILIRHFEPVFVSMSFGYYADSEILGMESLLRNYIFNLDVEDTLKESAVIEYLHSLGISHVVNPFTISYKWYHVDGSMTVRESTDYLEISGIACYLPDKINCSYLGSSVLN